jgi:hypothetical protein
MSTSTLIITFGSLVGAGAGLYLLLGAFFSIVHRVAFGWWMTSMFLAWPAHVNKLI